MNIAPAVLRQLIGQLEDKFQDRLPQSQIKEVDLARAIGQQDVLRVIRDLIERNER